MHLDTTDGAVRERVCFIPSNDGTAAAQGPVLVGVLSERDLPNASRGPRRGIVLLSSGRERRSGAHRVWVPFARERAARGEVVLRVDVAGIADSAPRASLDPQGLHALFDPRCADDVARAVDWLRREHGVGHCTVMGVCSGAYHAWKAALAGADVQQVVAINPVMFHFKPGMSVDPRDHAFGQIAIAASAGRSLLDPGRLRKLLSGRVDVRVILAAILGNLRRSGRLRARELGRLAGLPLKDDLAAELQQVAARGVQLDFVFSREDPGLVVLAQESGRRGQALKREERLRVRVVDDADHTFAGALGRAGLYARIDALLQPVPAADSPAASAASSPSSVHDAAMAHP
jgi:pimeloyl-ACP methyl ester carboxylesterase